jgi:hypothetical protein
VGWSTRSKLLPQGYNTAREASVSKMRGRAEPTNDGNRETTRTIEVSQTHNSDSEWASNRKQARQSGNA